MASHDPIDNAIFRHMQVAHKLAIGERMGARIKATINSTAPTGGNAINVEVRGRDMVSGAPKKMIISAREIREAIRR